MTFTMSEIEDGDDNVDEVYDYSRRSQSMKIDHWKAIDIINIINKN